MISIDQSLIIHIINFLFLILGIKRHPLQGPSGRFSLNVKRRSAALIKRSRLFLTTPSKKILHMAMGSKPPRAKGLKEKEVFLQAAADEERKIIEQINRKNQETFAEVQVKIQKDAEAAKAALMQEVDAFCRVDQSEDFREGCFMNRGTWQRKHRLTGVAGGVLLGALIVVLLSAGILLASSGSGHEGAAKGWETTDTYRIMNFVVLAVALYFALRKPVAQALQGANQRDKG